ncbi:transcription factor GTE4 [Canna indica]|uniref:Transcription factor GTE4 n=1 Tax=Canna indica TaxID=4628 RepID=A0AAQ3Q8X5_9LILI|nr:transcription factor GTE4 [Canna indica]
MAAAVATKSHQEIRELRRKLAAELEQVRSFYRRLVAHKVQLASMTGAPTAGYTHSQLSVTDPNTPVASKRAAEVAIPSTATAGPFSRQLSASVVATENILSESMEKEKRAPKANLYYQNSDFFLGRRSSLHLTRMATRKQRSMEERSSLPSFQIMAVPIQQKRSSMYRPSRVVASCCQN